MDSKKANSGTRKHKFRLLKRMQLIRTA